MLTRAADSPVSKTLTVWLSPRLCTPESSFGVSEIGDVPQCLGSSGVVRAEVFDLRAASICDRELDAVRFRFVECEQRLKRAPL